MIDKDRWERVENIYHAALAHEPRSREEFLDEACNGDTEIRHEVDSLLKFDVQAEGFIETPAVEIAARSMAAGAAPTNAESITEIGPYQLLSIIGQGSSGEVYLAVDTRLNRRVAIKLLSADFSGDTERISRFKQEARTTSTLNHPNIVTIFEIGEFNSRHYIVTEYVEGETLRARLSGPNPLAPKEAPLIALQVVEALAAAHQEGIIHRDIKPDNIIIRRDGLVKVLDFGIAKLVAFDPSMNADHLTTHTGIVMGTAAYMSPEQARGQKVDHRTDIFSVGVMLYEMLTGRKPFAGDTWSDVIAAVLMTEPTSLAVLAPSVPASLQEVVARCLQKKPEQRFQTASDLAFSLRQLAASVSTATLAPETVTTPAFPANHASRRVIWIAPVILAAIVLGVVLLWKGSPLGGAQPKQPRPAIKAIEAKVLTRLTWFDRSGKALSTVAAPAEYSGPAFSPDGDSIAVAINDSEGGARDLWILSAASGRRSRLTTEGSDDLNPLWTPDGKWIIFTSAKDGVRNIYRKLADSTGPVEPVLTAKEQLNVEDISHDGRFLVFNARNKPDDPPGLSVLSLRGGRRTSFAAPPTRAGRFSLTDAGSPMNHPEPDAWRSLSGA